MARKTKETIGHVKRLNSNDKFWLGMFLIPNLSMYFLFILIPSAVGVLLSFCEWDLLHPVKWIGLDFKELCFSFYEVKQLNPN